MTRSTMTGLVVLCIPGLMAACGTKGDDGASDSAGSELDTAPAEPTESEKADPKEASDAGAPDAGEDLYKKEFVFTRETTVDEIAVFVEHLKNRAKEIDLREREVIHREQMVASLETATMQQVEVLWKLKSQTAALLDKVQRDFREERRAYEEKLKKETARHAKEEAAEKERRKKETAELKRVAEEMTEERERRIVHLTATIKGMRAAAGASMLASMTESDAVAVLRQLGARQAAALLGNMPADRAAALAEAMLGPRPVSPDLVGAASSAPSPGKEDGR